jgi:hypothetical protein
MSKFEGTLPPQNLSKIWCDFNAWGLSAEPGDTCYYSFDRESFLNLPPAEHRHIFIWDDSDVDEIIGFVAILERYPEHITGWRARPDERTWYRGPKNWL